MIVVVGWVYIRRPPCAQFPAMYHVGVSHDMQVLRKYGVGLEETHLELYVLMRWQKWAFNGPLRHTGGTQSARYTVATW